MIRVLLITQDQGLEASFEAMAACTPDLLISAADPEEALAAASTTAPNLLLVDADTTAEAAELVGALTLVQPAPVGLLTERFVAEDDPLRQCGADALATKAGGPFAPRLAGDDGPAFASWLIALVGAAR